MVNTEGSNCTCEQWVGGAWTWHSDARVNLSMERSKARSEYGLNLKYATAMAIAAIDVIYQKAILLGKPTCEVPTKQNEQAGDDDSEEDEDVMIVV